MQAVSIMVDQISGNLGHGQILLSEPRAERIGVAELPTDALARIVSRLKFGGQGVQLGSHWTGAHPVQDMGCCEIGFDQVLLLSGQLADRKTVSVLCRVAQSLDPRCQRRETTSGPPACGYPVLGIRFQTL